MLSTDVGKDARRESALDLLKAVLNPRKYITAPPNLYHETAFSKRLDILGNVQVGTDTGLTAPGVPTQSGMILWLPNRGAGSVYRMGFIPSSTVISVTPTFPATVGTAGALGLVFPTVVINGNMGSVATFYNITGVTTLTFNAPLAVPYNTKVSVDTISIAPNLSTNFSTVRVYNGDLRLLSESTPIGATALNGVFSIGSVSDTRDVAQVATAGAAYTAYDPNSLKQYSVTKKEGLKEVPVDQGILSLVGSDIPPFYTNPNADFSDTIRGQFTQFTAIAFLQITPGVFPPASNTFSNYPASQAGGSGILIATTWITPWQITASSNQPSSASSGAPVAPPTGVNNIYTGPIDECGVLDIGVEFTFAGFDNDGGNAGGPVHLAVDFYHYYATCSSTGQLTWTVDADHRQFNAVVQAGSFGQYNSQAFKLLSESNLFRKGYTTTGKYMGCLVQIAGNTDLNGANVPAAQQNNSIATGLLGPSTTQAILSPGLMFQVRARTLNERGWVGPARILRWDNMSAGQVLKIDGVVNAQCIPAGSIAPFVQDKAMLTLEAVDLNTLPWLAVLFNGPTGLRRDWIATEYAKFLEEEFPLVSAEKLLEWTPHESLKLLAAGEASGSFGGLLNGLGRVAGTALGGYVAKKIHEKYGTPGMKAGGGMKYMASSGGSRRERC